MGRRQEDLELLRLVLASEKLDEESRAAFVDMLGRLDEKYDTLTEKQRSYVKNVGERLELVHEYENGISNGTVPRGREVTLLVRDKPLRPPQRKRDE